MAQRFTQHKTIADKWLVIISTLRLSLVFSIQEVHKSNKFTPHRTPNHITNFIISCRYESHTSQMTISVQFLFYTDTCLHGSCNTAALVTLNFFLAVTMFDCWWALQAALSITSYGFPSPECSKPACHSVLTLFFGIFSSFFFGL